MRGEARFPTVQKEVLAALAKGQQPYATIIGCSDSRVPPELLFDAGFGELFIVRVAGNVISPEIMGTLQYAGVHLHTPLFVVLGHEGVARSGGAGDRVSTVRVRARASRCCSRTCCPVCEHVDLTLPPRDLLDAAVEANVRWSMHQLLDTPEGRSE